MALKSMPGTVATSGMVTSGVGSILFNILGVIDVKKYRLVQKLESKKGLQCVVLERSIVIITCGMGITKVEAVSKD